MNATTNFMLSTIQEFNEDQMPYIDVNGLTFTEYDLRLLQVQIAKGQIDVNDITAKCKCGCNVVFAIRPDGMIDNDCERNSLGLSANYAMKLIQAQK
jgi:hypothetical protein